MRLDGRRVELLPEPDEPGMMTVIDREAPGYEPYTSSVESPLSVPQGSPFQTWRSGILIVVLSILVLSYPLVESILFGPLVPTSEWAFEETELRDLQDIGLDGSGIHVCMVDTGVDRSHPALIDAKFGGFLDLVNPENGDFIDHGIDYHGTMMAGLLIAEGAFQGGAPGVTLSVAAALGPTGYSIDDDAVGQAIDWCWRVQKADIISLSLGGEADPSMAISGPTVSAVEDALASGTYIVAAAGNRGENSSDVSIPGAIEGVISVAASTRTGDIWVDASRGSEVFEGETRSNPNLKPEIASPGQDIISTNNPELGVPYASSSGSSVSTVFVTAALALILEAHGEKLQLIEEQSVEEARDVLKTALMQSANSDYEGHDNRLGYGVLDALDWERSVAESLS
ncbi:MAG TPA: S8 family serine peptidase [Candidatus Thalassarchaeaceae archaeon]|nr:MAG TPA: hypothetical protein D7H85_00325 [Candidatus Poseidoniales archaeon]HII48306.1 S8 family serine peptidase [Candidatus Thalassarchaeaceae archaeon]|tara:strand:- start:1601 stop:2794 length:1194 start_codon:yes stop_codon:yes gene_type:complete